MEKDFDFDRVGKRMPYRVPDGFFDEMEANIRREVLQRPARPARQRVVGRRAAIWIAAVAATLTLLFVLNLPTGEERTVAFRDVEQAFANLSDDDRAYLLDVYSEDIFMNE